MNDQENPFVKKSEQTRAKPGRKPITPNFEQVLKAVERGEYDDELHELTAAIKTRSTARQEHVLRLVNEVFGDDATIEYTKSQGDDSEFIRSRIGIGGDHGQLMPSTTANVDQGRDLSEDVSTELDHQLDEVEARMESEGAPNDAPEPQPAQYVAPEQRGAMISGLHSSDMGQ